MTYTRHIKTKITDERYTPKWVFESLDITFDIDVAAPKAGPLHVPCKQWFSIDDDALQQTWHGTIWMNPPYSKPTPWIDKFIEHGNGIALMPTSIGKWWYRTYRHPNVYATPLPPIRFEWPDHNAPKTHAPWRSWLFAMGEQAINATKRLEQLHTPCQSEHQTRHTEPTEP